MNYYNRTKWKGWSPLEHRLFPQDLRYSVRVMLMCQNRVIQDTDADAVALSELKSCHSSSGNMLVLVLVIPVQPLSSPHTTNHILIFIGLRALNSK